MYEIKISVHGKIRLAPEIGDVDYISPPWLENPEDLCSHPGNQAEVCAQIQILVVFFSGIVGGEVKARATLASVIWCISSEVWQ